MNELDLLAHLLSALTNEEEDPEQLWVTDVSGHPHKPVADASRELKHTDNMAQLLATEVNRMKRALRSETLSRTELAQKLITIARIDLLLGALRGVRDMLIGEAVLKAGFHVNRFDTYVIGDNWKIIGLYPVKDDGEVDSTAEVRDDDQTEASDDAFTLEGDPSVIN